MFLQILYAETVHVHWLNGNIYLYIKNAASTVFCSNYIIHVVSIFTKYPDGDSICSNGTLVKILNNASNIDLLIM